MRRSISAAVSSTHPHDRNGNRIAGAKPRGCRALSGYGGSLGDGIFPAREFLDAGGLFGVGTDSNVLIGVADELRHFDMVSG